LCELAGPVTGAIQLPLRLDWPEWAVFHLDDPAERNVMYERVIRRKRSREVGRVDIDAIRELTRSYGEMDNRLGGGKLRSSVASYLDDHVSLLLTAGSYQETGRLTSARSVRYVRDLVRVLRPRADVPAVRDFTAEVRERLPAAAGHAAHR
jgi:hypothetical protein